jgi:hypothetical protein
MHLFVKEFGEEYLDDLAWLECRGRSLAEIARLLGTPSRAYRVIDSVIYSMRRNRYPIGDQRAVVLKLLTMTKALKHGSEFNEDRRNVIYSPDEAGAAASKLDRPIGSVAESQLVHRFCAGLWAYTEAICFRAHDITKEFHGPYHGRDRSKQFLVKEFLNLRPLELWPDMPLLPCTRVTVYQQYTDGVRIGLDALNHLLTERGTLVQSLDACAIEIDGQPQELSVLPEYVAAIQKTVAAISRHVDAIGWNDRVMKYAEIFWFRKKPLADARGRDWRVPPHVREAIARGTENERRRAALSDEACERLAMLTI